MAAATNQEVVDASKCWGDCIPDKWAALLWEFNQIRINGGGAVMTTQEIVDASKCFGNCIPDKWAVLLWSSNQIVANGTGGGQMSCGNGAPVAAPLDPTKCAIYYDNAAGGVPYFWNVGTAAWN